MVEQVLLLSDGRAAVVTDDPDRVDREVVWRFLSAEAYWGTWRSRADVEAQLDDAWRLVSAHLDGVMVGFARAQSDGVALAYLADVFVVPGSRGLGVGTAVVRLMVEDGPGSGFRWMLHTKDAHALYRGFGFGAPDHTCLERPMRLPPPGTPRPPPRQPPRPPPR